MCIIAFAPKGVEPPTTEQLTEMWVANPDGAGYAFEDTRRKQIIFRKGFMTLPELLADLEQTKRRYNLTACNFAVHFRIRTSGGKDAKTCHPFPISTRYGDLCATQGVSTAVLFHNGILAEGGLIAKHSSDTQDFVAAFAPLLSKPFKSKARNAYVNACTEGNRLLVLYPGGRVKAWGEWEKDGELFVSNTYYKTAYRYASSVSEDYETPTPAIMTPVPLTESDKERADKLWSEIERDYWRKVSPDELTLLKRTAITEGKDWLIGPNGANVGYTEETGYVWTEF